MLTRKRRPKLELSDKPVYQQYIIFMQL